MNIRHFLQIKKESFNQLKNGDKRLEVRVGTPQIKKIQRGDTITFENCGPNEFDVVRVRIYSSVESMMQSERIDELAPGRTTPDTLRELKELYPPYKETLGVYVLELRLRSGRSFEPEYIRLSQLLKDGMTSDFARIAAESYTITDILCDDYPWHCRLYFSKYIPGVFTGEREIITCFVDSRIAGTVVLKKVPQERKLCTLMTRSDFDRFHVEQNLLEMAFDWLETARPLCSVPDHRLEQWAGIIKRFGWQETQILKKGYYNNRSAEHVFNGKISKSCQMVAEA